MRVFKATNQDPNSDLMRRKYLLKSVREMDLSGWNYMSLTWVCGGQQLKVPTKKRVHSHC